jgi:hypothetical protein
MVSGNGAASHYGYLLISFDGIGVQEKYRVISSTVASSHPLYLLISYPPELL